MKLLEKKGLAELIPKMKELLEKYAGRIEVPVDVAVDADAMEKAEESARNLKIFENDDELLEKLDVSDEQVLKNVPLHVLANRIMKRMHKDFFYQGYTKRKEEKLSDKFFYL